MKTLPMSGVKHPFSYLVKDIDWPSWDEAKLSITDNVLIQSWKMSNLLHGPISTNQILPGEKRVNRDILAPQTYKTELIGFLVMNKLSIYGSLSIDLNFFCTYLPKNGLFLLIILASQTFYPNCPIFLHGYIRHIRHIFQLCSLCQNSKAAVSQPVNQSLQGAGPWQLKRIP